MLETHTLQIIILTTLLTLFFDALGQKHNWFDDLHRWGMSQKNRFFYKLSSCRFCILFHVGTFSFVVVMFLTIFNISYLLTPFCVAGVLKLINYDNKP